MTPARAARALLLDKRLGKKVGQGFYLHTQHARLEGEARARRRPRALRAARLAAPRRCCATRRSLDRALLAMLNEAARALEEEVVAGPRELDLATIFGMGFPPFRGGLLAWADSLGAKELVARLERIAGEADIAARTGGKERFTPAASLKRMAASGARFHG